MLDVIRRHKVTFFVLMLLMMFMLILLLLFSGQGNGKIPLRGVFV